MEIILLIGAILLFKNILEIIISIGTILTPIKWIGKAILFILSPFTFLIRAFIKWIGKSIMFVILLIKSLILTAVKEIIKLLLFLTLKIFQIFKGVVEILIFLPFRILKNIVQSLVAPKKKSLPLTKLDQSFDGIPPKQLVTEQAKTVIPFKEYIIMDINDKDKTFIVRKNSHKFEG